MAVSTRPWDVAEYLDTPERRVLYLEAAFEEEDPKAIFAAIGDIARAMGMMELAEQTGLAREALYRSLSERGNPEFVTVLKVLDALGIKLTPTVRADEAA